MIRIVLILTTALICSAVTDGVEEAQHLRRVQRKQPAKPKKEKPLKPKDKPSSVLECVPILKLIQFEPGQFNSGPDKEWLCELLPRTAAAGNKNGVILKLVDLENLPTGSLKESRSGKDVLSIPDAIVTGNVIRIPPNKQVEFEKRFIDDKKKDEAAGRRLQSVDERKVLVVRITATGSLLSSSPTSNASQISSSIFGGDGDIVNLVSQMHACSFGQIAFSPLVAEGLPPANAPNVGVFEISDIYPEKIGDTKSTTLLRNSVTSVLAEALPDFGVPGCSWCTLQDALFDHVMYCMPPGTDMGASGKMLCLLCRFCILIFSFSCRSRKHSLCFCKQLVECIQRPMVHVLFSKSTRAFLVDWLHFLLHLTCL